MNALVETNVWLNSHSSSDRRLERVNGRFHRLRFLSGDGAIRLPLGQPVKRPNLPAELRLQGRQRQRRQLAQSVDAQKVQAVDPNKKLCVTEFGWATSEGYDAPPQGFEFALDNTLQEQADYLVQAFQTMHDSGNVWLAFVFNYDFGNKGSGPQDDPVPYSIIDVNGAPRPAFEALAAMEKVP